MKFYADEACTTEFDISTPINQHTNIYVKILRMPAPYTINSVTIKDMSGNELSEIPESLFLATVSITNNYSDDNAVVILAQYTASGAFEGLIYVSVEDMPIGSTFKLSVPVNNTSGNVSKLKAFSWKSFASMTPLGNSVIFPAE